MRKIEFYELKLKNTKDANTFYQSYLQTFQKQIPKEDSFQYPSKQYEICYLNILDGKLVLLNKDYIEKQDISGQELFFDYSLALTIYSLMLDIQDGILDEKQECNELYKEERLKKEEEIEKYKQKDEVGLAKVLLKAQKFSIGNTFGLICLCNHYQVNELAKQYGIRNLQKKIFKMSDIENCSFLCMGAENAPKQYDLEFRSTATCGDFNVLKLASQSIFTT